jgi:hypothetical protein
LALNIGGLILAGVFSLVGLADDRVKEKSSYKWLCIGLIILGLLLAASGTALDKFEDDRKDAHSDSLTNAILKKNDNLERTGNVLTNYAELLEKDNDSLSSKIDRGNNSLGNKIDSANTIHAKLDVINAYIEYDQERIGIQVLNAGNYPASDINTTLYPFCSGEGDTFLIVKNPQQQQLGDISSLRSFIFFIGIPKLHLADDLWFLLKLDYKAKGKQYHVEEAFTVNVETNEFLSVINDRFLKNIALRKGVTIR